MSAAVVMALIAGAAAALATWDLLGRLAGSVGARAPALARGGAGLVDVLVRQGREGRDPGTAERRRLLLAGAFIAFLVGAALAGPLPGLALAAGVEGDRTPLSRTPRMQLSPSRHQVGQSLRGMRDSSQHHSQATDQQNRPRHAGPSLEC